MGLVPIFFFELSSAEELAKRICRHTKQVVQKGIMTVIASPHLPVRGLRRSVFQPLGGQGAFLQAKPGHQPFTSNRSDRDDERETCQD